jgi:histidinol-phosphate aminotransferase
MPAKRTPAKTATKTPGKAKTKGAAAAAEAEKPVPVVAEAPGPDSAPAPVAKPAVYPDRPTPRALTAGLPVYEPGRPLEEVAREFGFVDTDLLIKLASNENPLGPPPKAVMAMQLATSRMHLYPDGGCFYLRRKLAEYLNLPPDRFIFGAGSNEIIEFLGKTFLEPGDNIVVSQHAFIVYKLVGLSCAAEVREAPMQQFTHDLGAMAALCDARTRLLFVANPNNPTGTMLGLEELREGFQRVPPHVLIVLDEAYIDLLHPDECPATLSLLAEFPNLITLRTFSKAFGLAGLRLGYGMAAPEIIAALEKFRQPFNVSSMAQVAAIAALDDHDHLYRTRYNNEAGIKYLASRFRVMKLEYVPSHANFLLVKTGRGRELFREMQKGGIIVRPMDGYGLPDHLRISVGTPEQNRVCIAALQHLLQPEVPRL